MGQHKYESHWARADASVAAELAGTKSPFTIEVRFLGGLTGTQMAAFAAAADRWCRVIVGDLPSVFVDGEVIDDVLILAQGVSIDGPGSILGQAGPTHLRPKAAGAAADLPAKGIMSFDTADLAQMEDEGTLNDVIAHEMGHVLGSGTIWELKGLLQGKGTINPTFVGDNAINAYGQLRPGGPAPVPVANVGGPGTRDSHWRESVFANELMSGVIAAAGNPLSIVTVASLADMGYTVDISKAEGYQLPAFLDLAELGLLSAHDDHGGRGVMLSTVQIELPEESLQV